MKEIRVAVDFDNCLVEWQGLGNEDFKFLNGAKETINDLSQKGFKFILNTVRYDELYTKATNFLIRTGVNIVFEEWKNKIPADVYIDDRNIFCKNIDWEKIREELLNMKSNR